MNEITDLERELDELAQRDIEELLDLLDTNPWDV